MRKIAAWSILMPVALTLAACGTPPNPLMGTGHTPDYAAGFNDGCSSGRASQDPVAGFYTKNTARFASDNQYAAGWNAGYAKCSYNQMEQDAFGGRR
jgi:hypothetical protein